MIPAQDAIAKLSRALGGSDAAALAAAALVEADAIGQPRFGISMLDEWTSDASPPPVANGSRAVAWLDCTDSFAPLAVASATLDLAQTAKQLGIGAVFLRGVRGFGRFAPFLRPLADSGLIALAGAEGPPFVAPHGGTRPVVGTNPLAFAMGRGGDRVIIDAASSSMTMADIRSARAEDRPLPTGSAVDAAGAPTNVAADVVALLPRGGQVGSLLGLVVELMAGVAAGGRGDPKGRGVFLVAIDPTVAGEETGWQDKLAALRNDWTGADGHWPRGGGLAPDATLDDAFRDRLDTYLGKMPAEAGGAR